jgi:hypothetical protein
MHQISHWFTPFKETGSVLNQKSQGILKTLERPQKRAVNAYGYCAYRNLEELLVAVCNFMCPKPQSNNVLQNWLRPLAHEILLTTEIWATDLMKGVRYGNFMFTETYIDENCKI